MRNLCGGLDGDEFTDCILQKCGGALNSLVASNRECASSLMAQVGKSSLMGLLAVLSPFKRAGLFAYKGSDGLLLLSRSPLVNTQKIDFSDISTLNRRVALTAEVDGQLIVCTHLTADHGAEVPYTGKFKTWKDEHRAQVERLLYNVAKKDQPSAILGDFNCGPKVTNLGIQGELSKSCSLFKMAGHKNALFEFSPECTFCAGNSLNDEDSGDKIIDHIFVKNSFLGSAKILFKEPVLLKSGVKSNLSDHFGLQIEVMPR
jgi:endonuclease/exonuclease/phosphatase family metal-dependent hydrolase